MNLSPVEEGLFRAFEEFEIVDAHEHIPPEEVRLKHSVDVFTLFSHYTREDLFAAGMPEKNWERIHDSTIPLDKRWEMFAPYLKHIRYGTYARPAFIAAEEFYGFDDINEGNYRSLSERMAAANTRGIYHRILREKCRIRTALTQSNRTDYDLDLLIPLMPLDDYAAVRSKKSIEESAIELGEKVRTIEDYLDLVRKGLEAWKSDGVIGIKMASRPYGESNSGQARALFEKLILSESKELPQLNSLYSFLMEEMLDMAAELGLVVAVHTGMWGDFRTLDPQHMIPILSRHPKTKFDIYHLGIPYVREAMIIGKNFPNVWLNLCWCHIISQRITCSALDELMDLVPINKIIAFGGDYRIPIEKVYGHLVMAREDIARVLGRRIQDGLMTENEAVDIAKMWFRDNPKQLYRLKL